MSRKDTSAIVGGAGWVASFVDGLLKGLRERGCTDEQIHSLVTGKAKPAMGSIADVVATVIQAAKNIFRITLTGKPASELVKLGKYDSVNNSITDRLFPIRDHAPVFRTIELVEFDHNPTSKEVLAEFTRRGLKRPTPEDALTFGIEYPKKQRKCPIVFLHEPVWVEGNHSVLVLCEDVRGRRLALDWFGRRWTRYFVFAAVRK